MGVLGSILLLLIQAAQGASAEPPDWQWDRASPICTLRQQISSSGDMIEVSRTPANDETEIKITAQLRSKVREGRFRDGAITPFPADKAVADVALRVDDGKRLQVYAVTPDPAFVGGFSNASALEISHERIAPIKMDMRSAAAATAALHSCEDRKMREWGIDPVSWRALRSRPFPLKAVRDRFRDLDYPAAALAQSVETDAITRLDIAPDGTVERCQSLNSGDYKGFEEAACKVLKGARFRPASDSAGNAVAAPVVFDVRFRISD
jgi:TonB family protein